jgi:hypothetical protein
MAKEGGYLMAIGIYRAKEELTAIFDWESDLFGWWWTACPRWW